MRKNHITLKIIFLVLLNVLINSVAQVCMKKGLVSVGAGPIGLDHLPELIEKGASSPLIWAGILIYISSFFIWIIILSRTELSIAIPLSSIAYIVTPIMAVVFLKENVSMIRWSGIMLIVLGIYFLSKSSELKHEGSMMP